MAEIVGVIASGITLAALFKSCIEAFDLIQTGHNQELDLMKLVLRLNIEKCRLFTWGESMGLTSTPDEAEPTASASCEFREVMMQTLETIFLLFNDSKKLQDRYGCKQYLDSPATNDTEQTSHVRFLAASFDNFQITTLRRGKPSKLLMKVRWAIHDRKRFASFVSEIKELVDGLQHITKPLVPLSRQEDAMKRGIERINDAETLDMVSEVCQNDHSELSKVALVRAETISLASTNRWKIERWDCRTEDIELEEMVDLESLNITELKHQMLRMMRERKELEIQLQHLRGRVLGLPVPPAPFPVLPKFGESKSLSPPEHQQKGPDGAEEATAGVPIQMPIPALRSLEQNSSDGDDHVADQSGRLTQLEQSGPSCSVHVETGSEPYCGIRPIEELPVDSNWSHLVALSLTAPTDDPVYEQQDEGKHRVEGLNATVTDDIPHLQGFPPQGGALVSEPPVQLTSVNPRLDAPSASGPTSPNHFSGGVNVNTPGDKPAAPVQKPKTPTKKGHPSKAVRKHKITMPANPEDGGERKALFNGFLDYDVLTGSRARNKNQREDYFVLSFNVPRRTALFASLGHCHYAAASCVARLASSRNAPTLPSQWPRNLQITTFVDGSLMDQLLHKSFSHPLLHIYIFGIFEFVTTCSVEGGCLQVLFDVLAESGEYAECIPEITSLDYPTPRVYVVPIGASAVVPGFLRHIQPTLEPTSKILLLLLIYEEEDFATLNDKTVTRKVFRDHKPNSLPAKLSKGIMSTIMSTII
jgi:hypothetical protein